MKIDDLLYAPVGMAEEDKQFIWEIITAALGTEFLSEREMEELKNQLFVELNETGRIEINNKSDIRASFQEWRDT